MSDELPIAERAEAVRPRLEERGFLFARHPGDAVADEAMLEAVCRRFLEVASYLDCEADQLADGTLVAWPKGTPRPDFELHERRVNAHLN